jgi:outer membrane biosynthesis protein TonB
MLHTIRPLRATTGLMLLAALALVAALTLAPRASAWYCPAGTHESPPDSGQCVPDTPTTTTPAPPEQPPPKPEQPQQPAPPQPPPAAPQAPPAAVPAPAPPAPAPTPPAPPSTQAAPAPAQAVQQEVAEAPRPARERPSSAVRGEREVQSAPVAPQAERPTQLAFTGVDAGLIALMGLAFLGAGLLLRRQRAIARTDRRDIVAAMPGRR